MDQVTHLLDTNALVEILRGKGLSIVQRIEQHPPGSLAVSTVSLGELSFGAMRSGRDHEADRVQRLLSDFHIIPFDAAVACVYGEIRAELALKGKVIGGLDMMIAATARHHGWKLVTHNMREFKRITDLELEDWQ